MYIASAAAVLKMIYIYCTKSRCTLTICCKISNNNNVKYYNIMFFKNIYYTRLVLNDLPLFRICLINISSEN